jgi:hypothetical protein
MKSSTLDKLKQREIRHINELAYLSQFTGESGEYAINTENGKTFLNFPTIHAKKVWECMKDGDFMPKSK